MKKLSRYVAILLCLCLLCPGIATEVKAENANDTGIEYRIVAKGVYSNWEGVSNVSQFLDQNGNYCFAYDGEKAVTIVKTKDGKPQGRKITLKKKYPLFGGVACDAAGNYYLVTGRENKSGKIKNTVFISKYTARGKLRKTIGDNGSASLGSWYPREFYTRLPFDGGNCDIAVNGDYLAVHYAREMYNGHQSNSVFMINTKKMKRVKIGSLYSSHSFAQRALPYGDGFLFASEGDCYSRAFTISRLANPATGENTDSDIFHFWVEKGAMNSGNMFVLNDNFASMGGLAKAGEQKAALVGLSVKSLKSRAYLENQQIFIQIFDPEKNLEKASSYATKGKRKGLSGPNGDEKVTDYGVKWLTNYSNQFTVSNPQVVSADGRIVVLYELYKSGEYMGVYYMVLDERGKILKKKTKYSETARLNPCEMPVYSNGTVYWTGNRTTGNTMVVFGL